MVVSSRTEGLDSELGEFASRYGGSKTWTDAKSLKKSIPFIPFDSMGQMRRGTEWGYPVQLHPAHHNFRATESEVRMKFPSSWIYY